MGPTQPGCLMRCKFCREIIAEGFGGAHNKRDKAPGTRHKVRDKILSLVPRALCLVPLF
jgi:hypothetical protein